MKFVLYWFWWRRFVNVICNWFLMLFVKFLLIVVLVLFGLVMLLSVLVWWRLMCFIIIVLRCNFMRWCWIVLLSFCWKFFGYLLVISCLLRCYVFMLIIRCVLVLSGCMWLGFFFVRLCVVCCVCWWCCWNVLMFRWNVMLSVFVSGLMKVCWCCWICIICCLICGWWLSFMFLVVGNWCVLLVRLGWMWVIIGRWWKILFVWFVLVVWYFLMRLCCVGVFVCWLVEWFVLD